VALGINFIFLPPGLIHPLKPPDRDLFRGMKSITSTDPDHAF
jgi:hypothetical protein